jgi:hypothetical protein
MESRGQVVKAMALIQRPRDGALLVSEGLKLSGELFHRPRGGHVEFGEPVGISELIPTAS